MMRLALIPALLVLAACNPQTVAENVNRRAARTVVVPVLQAYMPAPQAEGVADCIIDNATPVELQTLARDVGNRAGTLTVQNVMNVARRPATVACITGRGLPVLPA